MGVVNFVSINTVGAIGSQKGSFNFKNKTNYFLWSSLYLFFVLSDSQNQYDLYFLGAAI